MSLPHRPAPSRSRRAPRAGLVLGLALAFLGTPGCGGGGAGNDSPRAPSAVQIGTGSLPSAGLSVPYSVSLSATGGKAPYTWTVLAGSQLPTGLTLSNAGLLSGTPTVPGNYGFDIGVSDGAGSSDMATYSLLVSTFDASVALLHWGEAWTGESYPISGVGAPTITFSFVTNASGGTITSTGATSAIYVPGNGTGTDRILATGSNDLTKTLDVPVFTNPVRNMTARFSNTDVWYLKFQGKKDTGHIYASDFDKALVTIGMRSPASTGVTGTTADEVAKAYVRQQTLRYINVMYGNAADGSALNGGFAISFPYVEPVAPHFAPADGRTLRGGTNQYNIMGMIAGSGTQVIGTAYLDTSTNPTQENNTTSSTTGDLGVFVDEIADFFVGAYGTQLRDAPITSADVTALKALLYGTTPPGGARTTLLRNIGEGYGRTLAAVAAHEIGHSLSLDHTEPSVSHSIMNAASLISPTETYTFVQSDRDRLSSALPGPGRGGVPAMVASQIVDPWGDEGIEGGTVVVCRQCRLKAHVAPAAPAK